MMKTVIEKCSQQVCRGFKSHPRQSVFSLKITDCSGCTYAKMCIVALPSLMRVYTCTCMLQVTLQLLEVMDVVLFCLDQEQVKKKNLLDLFPVISK